MIAGSALHRGLSTMAPPQNLLHLRIRQCQGLVAELRQSLELALTRFGDLRASEVLNLVSHTTSHAYDTSTERRSKKGRVSSDLAFSSEWPEFVRCLWKFRLPKDTISSFSICDHCAETPESLVVVAVCRAP